jgi:hypothetical protein
MAAWQNSRALVISHHADGKLLVVAPEPARSGELETLGSR